MRYVGSAAPSVPVGASGVPDPTDGGGIFDHRLHRSAFHDGSEEFRASGIPWDGPGRACRDGPWLFQTFPFREKEQEVSGVLCGTSGVGEGSNLPTEGLESIVAGERVI